MHRDEQSDDRGADEVHALADAGLLVGDDELGDRVEQHEHDRQGDADDGRREADPLAARRQRLVGPVEARLAPAALARVAGLGERRVRRGRGPC